MPLRQLGVIINMKNKNIISSVVGAGFFAVGYLALALPIAPALAIGAASFVASELVISGNKKIQEVIEPSNIQGVKIIKESNKLIIENSQLNLTKIYNRRKRSSSSRSSNSNSRISRRYVTNYARTLK